jgi:hypothetical protein
VLDLAAALGFFSIWITVFADDPGLKEAFVQRFAGTAADCFDANFDLQTRPGGRI